MKQGTLLLIIIVAALFSFTACSNTRHLPEGDRLYTGANVDVHGPITIRTKKVLQEDLQGLTRPKPNTKLLGVRLKLTIYNLFRKKKENSFWGRIRDRNGEPPVLLSQLDLQKNKTVLQSHLENKGFFRTKITGDTIIRGKKARARYNVETGDQYILNAIKFPEDSSILSISIRQCAKETFLKKDKPFDLDVIRAERLRIDAYLKERGFYFFSPEFILMRTDTTVGDHLVDMQVTIKQDIPSVAREVFRINDVYIYSNYSLNTAHIDTSKAEAEFFEGYMIIDRMKKFKAKLFAQMMKFEPGEVYNRTDHNLTLSRLINLNLFKFVKNRFEINTETDSSLLDAYYYLTPLPKKSLSAEVTTITRSNNLNGSIISAKWRNRNALRRGEQLSLSFYVGTDVQFSGALRGYNTYRTGAELNFAIPRFIVPGFSFRNKGGYVPRTNLQLGYDILNRRKLYTLNSFRGGIGYLWREDLKKSHELYPVSINYVQPLNVTAQYDSLVRIDTFLARAVEKQFILGSSYQYTYNPLAAGIQPVNAFYFNGLIDLSGNIAGLLSGANVKQGKEVTIRGVPFSQYIKMEFDGRFYRKVGVYSSWANRVIIGVGIPYGNSTQLPFIKQYFVGGNNSLRGFRSRSVGPGTYHYPLSTRFFPDQTGDLKLEFNTEFRPRINGPLYGAIFIDAGNIWLFNDTTYTHKPGAKFTSKFLNQLAIDVGVGLRLDITLFIVRFDVGFPIRKPWEQNPWVLNQLELHSMAGRRENIVYNLAIGYPF